MYGYASFEHAVAAILQTSLNLGVWVSHDDAYEFCLREVMASPSGVWMLPPLEIFYSWLDDYVEVGQ